MDAHDVEAQHTGVNLVLRHQFFVYTKVFNKTDGQLE